MREQIAEYMAQGMKQVDVANILGCSEANISETVKTEGFKELLLEKAKLYANARINTKYDELEEKTLNKLREIVNDGVGIEITDLTRILEAVAKIKNANRIPAANTYQNPTIGVMLIMPQQNIPPVIKDESNRILAIGERSMAAMPISNVKQLFSKISELNEKDLMPSTVKA